MKEFNIEERKLMIFIRFNLDQNSRSDDKRLSSKN